MEYIQVILENKESISFEASRFNKNLGLYKIVNHAFGTKLL